MMPATTTLDITGHIQRCVSGEHLSSDEMREAMGSIMDGGATPAQVSALLVSLAVKGETADEIIGAAQAMRAHAVSISCERRPLLDVCGTGGDASGSFNISTAVAFVVAGAGATVAKHGNRAMSSRCGSADVLEALGVKLDIPKAVSESLLNEHGIAFLYAQTHHPAMRFVATVRREIGVRTLFNLIGPLCNPAGATRQLVGVAQARTQPLVAQALRCLGSERAAVVCAEDGMDELSLSCATRVVEWNGVEIIEYLIEPETFGMERLPAALIAGADPGANARFITELLDGRSGPRRDVVLLNAALALQIAGIARDLQDGWKQAQRSIDSGAARAKLDALVRASNA